MLSQKMSFLFIVAAVTLVSSQSFAFGWRYGGGRSSGWTPVPSSDYSCRPSYQYSSPRYYSPSCGPSVRETHVAPSSAYRRYSTFDGGWVLVDQNDFIVDSSERRANGIYPANRKQGSERTPAPKKAPQNEKPAAAAQDRDLLSAPKRNQEAPSRHEGVDFFNAPKR